MFVFFRFSNRTLDGDTVVVELEPRENWRPIASPGKRLIDEDENDNGDDDDDDDFEAAVSSAEVPDDLGSSRANSAVNTPVSTPTKAKSTSTSATSSPTANDETDRRLASAMSGLRIDDAKQRETRLRELNEARDARGNRLQPTAKVVRITGRVCTNNFVGRLRTIRNDLKPQV